MCSTLILALSLWIPSRSGRKAVVLYFKDIIQLVYHLSLQFSSSLLHLLIILHIQFLRELNI